MTGSLSSRKIGFMGCARSNPFQVLMAIGGMHWIKIVSGSRALVLAVLNLLFPGYLFIKVAILQCYCSEEGGHKSCGMC